MIKFFKLFSSEPLINNPGIPEVEASPSLIQQTLTWFFVLSAVISFLVIVIAGFQFIISSGEPEKIAKARRTIIYAVVGLIVSLSASAIVAFIAGRF